MGKREKKYNIRPDCKIAALANPILSLSLISACVQRVLVQDMQVHQVLTAELALEFEPLSIQAFQGSHFIREWFVDIIFVILEVGAVF